MTNPIIDFIAQFISLSADEIDILNEHNQLKSFQKDSIILREGDTPKECYYILKGCIRKYYNIHGEERTTDFYTENQTITPAGYIRNKPSGYTLASTEDTLVSVGSLERNKVLVSKIPKLQGFIEQLNNQMLIEVAESFDNFKNLKPEQRYLNLLENKSALIDRVPQIYLASYLGITPESLSRIKKRTKATKQIII
ncbi:MAG: Crp/Fnr family transcriptional regulator [Flexibacteraceae bacterium]|jgi:CRP-like cAMP-binding protein